MVCVNSVHTHTHTHTHTLLLLPVDWQSQHVLSQRGCAGDDSMLKQTPHNLVPADA